MLAVETELRVVGDTKEPIFHPKLYVFKRADDSVCWIGSANLTGAAFSENQELICEIDNPKSIEALFSEWWVIGGVVTDSWLSDYEKRSDQYQTNTASAAKSVSHMGGPPPVSLEPTSWDAYVTMLQQIDRGRTDEIIALVNIASSLLNGDWSDLSQQRDLILGMSGFEELGSLKIAKIAKDIFSGKPEFLSQRYKVRNALREFNSVSVEIYSPQFDEALASAWNKITSINGLAQATTSRLLALVRPDACVSLNKKSISYFASAVGSSIQELETTEGYVNVCRWVRRQPWWKSEEPLDSYGSSAWKAKAALLDVLAYADWVRSNPRK
jgi:hypothetical protein